MKNITFENKFDDLFNKYTRHIEAHYGYALEWSPLQPMHKDIAFNFIGGEHLVLFPIRYKDKIVGSAKIKSEKTVKKTDARRMSDVIDLLFGPTMDSLERLKHSRRLEDNLLRSLKPTNVIPINRPKQDKLETLYDGEPTKRPQLFTPVLIQALSEQDISRLALEIHYSLERSAFLHFNDLDLATRIQVAELKTLGPISLFVPNILNLSRTEQHTLIDLCELAGTREVPLIISGTTDDYEQLLKKTEPIKQLTKALSVTYLRLTKDFKEYKKQGILPFIYENLTEPITHLDS